MRQERGLPEIFWVVGNGPGVGKTTLAAALIKVLNTVGKRAVGFKPFAGGLLLDLVDFMLENYPAAPSRLFGSDGWQLTLASPLTGVEHLDLVVPVQLVCYPFWDSTLLMRSGAAQLDNVEFFCGSNTAKFESRADLRDLASRAGLPFDRAVARDDLKLPRAHRVSPEKPQEAFEALLALGVEAVVCEGSAASLPVWQGSPPPDHVFLSGFTAIDFIPNAGFDFPFDPAGDLPDVGAIKEVLRRRNHTLRSIPRYLAESSRRDQLAQQTVRHLMTHDRAADPPALP